MNSKKIKESIYMLAAIETLVNNNSSTDLGDYSLEYGLKIENISRMLVEDTDIALGIMARLKNKATNKVESADIFYKIIEKSDRIEVSKENETLEKIMNMEPAQKLDFILRPENRLSKEKFKKTLFSQADSFFDDANIVHNDAFNYPVVHYGIDLPLEVQNIVQQKVNDYLLKLKEDIIGVDNKGPKNNL